uniref:Uncharacterized protein n=1 Tax=Kalanchoe fedtschenkoi TaxID=63787 RepID=A0A7N0ZX91_KALFE
MTNSLSTTSRAGVDKLLKRVKSRGARPRNEKVAWPDKEHGKVSTSEDMDVEYVPKSSLEATDGEVSDHQGVTFDKIDDEADDSIWEDGYAPDPGFNNSDPDDASNGVEVDISWPEESPQKRPTRRFSAEEKEIAENLHKVNLLCLLARGRVVDRACDDSLIQAALLSLVPRALHEISELSHVTKISLAPVVLWFHKHFSIRAPKPVERSFPASLASALDAGEGTPEEIAALSVALFRALNLTTRYAPYTEISINSPWPFFLWCVSFIFIS